MISPRLARRIATIHKWLGLIVALQLVVWTSTGLFFACFKLTDVRGEHLAHEMPMDMRRAKYSLTEALRSVAEDAPTSVQMRSIAGEPAWEIRAEIGVFLVSAETLAVMSPIDEDLARRIAVSSWQSPQRLAGIELIDHPPPESGLRVAAWVARFEGDGHPTLYINAINGELGPARTDLWRTYDFFYGLHLMDYADHENAHSPWMIALAVLAVSTVLFGIALLVHRFTRGVLKPKAESPK
jgi:uncharacterized iron-regulated membrane protein